VGLSPKKKLAIFTFQKTVMTTNRYKTAAAFRRALEDRLQIIAVQSNLELQRLRRKVAFNRFLARMFADKAAGLVLKGGYSMELRLTNARSTRDIDLSFIGKTGAGGSKPDKFILELLQSAVSRDLNDYFTFQIGKLQMELDAPVYGGARYPVHALIDGKLFIAFHVDVAMGDYMPAKLERMAEPDWLSFAGIAMASFSMIPRAVQFAEKLHSYTLPRAVPNSRVRDLVDMILLIKEGKLDKAELKQMLAAVFDRRKTHALPTRLDMPPDTWAKPFQAMAANCGLEENIAGAFEVLNQFYSSL
jgi:hypothetical protein